MNSEIVQQNVNHYYSQLNLLDRGGESKSQILISPGMNLTRRSLGTWPVDSAIWDTSATRRNTARNSKEDGGLAVGTE